MDKKQREAVKKEFLKVKRVVMVNDGGYRLPLDEYTEQEKYARKIKTELAYDNHLQSIEAKDLGILEPGIMEQTNDWYLDNCVKRGINPFEKR